MKQILINNLLWDENNYIDPLTKKQNFTYLEATAKAKNLGKRLPTVSEFTNLLKNNIVDFTIDTVHPFSNDFNLTIQSKINKELILSFPSNNTVFGSGFSHIVYKICCLHLQDNKFINNECSTCLYNKIFIFKDLKSYIEEKHSKYFLYRNSFSKIGVRFVQDL